MRPGLGYDWAGTRGKWDFDLAFDGLREQVFCIRGIRMAFLSIPRSFGGRFC